MSAYRVFLLVTALVLYTTSAKAERPSSDSLNGHFAGWSDVDANGRLSAFTPDGQAVPAVAQALRAELDRQVFSPARDASGTPRPVRTYLTGRYVLKPDKDGWLLRIIELRAGPKLVTQVMPRPPHRTFAVGESVWMRAAMTVGADGKATNIVIEELQGPQAFLREARDALRKWRFEPESAGGQPIATMIRQEYSISLDDKAAHSGPPCPLDAASGRVLAPGQTSCLALIETTLVKHSGRGRNHVSVP